MPLVCLTWPRENRTSVVDLKENIKVETVFFQEHPPITDEGGREHSNKYSKLREMEMRDQGTEISCGFFLDGLLSSMFFPQHSAVRAMYFPSRRSFMTFFPLFIF